MASFDAYRSPAELRKLYLHCQYLARGLHSCVFTRITPARRSRLSSRCD